MTLVVMGIDPGATGGIAVVNGSVSAVPMPDLWTFARTVSFWAGFGDNLHVFVEKSQAFPGQGISSTFSYGRHFGELLGVLAALNVRHTLVAPAQWTRSVHAGTKAGDPKVRTLEAVRRLFPGVSLLASPKCKVPHSGMVDALAIAWYGRQSLTGGLHDRNRPTAVAERGAG